MKMKTIYLLGGAALAYYLYTKSKQTAAVTAAVTAPATTAGALGAYMTGNPMLEELGSLGSSAWKGARRY